MGMPSEEIPPRHSLLVGAGRHYVRLTNGRMRTRRLDVVIAEEAELEKMRLSKAWEYSLKRHIEVLAEYMTIKRKEQDQCTS